LFRRGFLDLLLMRLAVAVAVAQVVQETLEAAPGVAVELTLK
jgi:hypothetical protein